METRKIITSAFAAAVSVHFDVMQQTFRSPVRFWFVQHSGETERDFEKGPAIHSLEIHRGRFDPIVDLESEVLITCSYQRLSYRRRPFPYWQGLPISGFGLCNQSIELILSLKDSAERQARFRTECDRMSQ